MMHSKDLNLLQAQHLLLPCSYQTLFHDEKYVILHTIVRFVPHAKRLDRSKYALLLRWYKK